MRFLILNTFYPQVIEEVYQRTPGLQLRSYAEQASTLFGLGFGLADFTSLNLRKLGHEAEEVIVNCEPLQWCWAQEHGLRIEPNSDSLRRQVRWQVTRYVRGAKRRLGLKVSYGEDDWLARVVEAQVEAFKPDIVLNRNLVQFPARFLKRLRQRIKILVGQCAYPIPDSLDLTPYDLIVSAFPGFVERFRKKGVASEFLPHGFETSVLEYMGPLLARHGVVFTGNLTKSHTNRIRLITELARRVPVDLWISGEEHLPQTLVFLATIHPPVWGYEMYRTLYRAKIGLNTHIDVAGGSASSMRLFEVTGMGALLITDYNDDLDQFFEIGKECVVYRTPQECAELVSYYLEHDTERAAIAQAGQARTLSDHTLYQRMQVLCHFVENAME